MAVQSRGLIRENAYKKWLIKKRHRLSENKPSLGKHWCLA